VKIAPVSKLARLMVDLRKLRRFIAEQRGALPISWIGVWGSLIAAVGAFCPIVDSLGHHGTYFARGHGDGQIVVGAAFIGLMAATIRVRFVTALGGVVILALLYDLYKHGITTIARLEDSFWSDWGLYVMAFGAVLMLASPLIRRSRTR
jgi:hypothetical protein